MNFTGLHDFLAMGGYAAYVWPAYAVFLAVLIADSLAPTVRRRQVLRDLRAQLARQAARHARKGATIPGSAPHPSAPPPRSA
ncbi:MAG TPA: heme exporter protein CcmD [Rhodanobacter sp.]|jgi:heme exporter protein D